MKTKLYRTTIYFTGFCTYEIEAPDEAEAILKSRKLPVKQDEIITI